MSPNDLKAIKICAKLMGVPLEGYNPIENDQQAKELAERLHLTVDDAPEVRTRHQLLRITDISRDGKFVMRFSNFEENAALVHAACYSEDPKWFRKKSAE